MSLIDKARQLRHNITPAEKKLWYHLKNRNLSGHKFHRRHPIVNCSVDFYCPEQQLAIEIDGDTHIEQEEYDAQRTQNLNKRGIKVLCFQNRQVLSGTEQVLDAIMERELDWKNY